MLERGREIVRKRKRRGGEVKGEFRNHGEIERE